MQPLLPWESDNADHPDLVWRSKMDKRYLIEAHRADGYHGKLYIFDHEKDDREIACWEVILSYGAMFGPDVADVDVWLKKAEDFVDNTYKPE